MLTPLTCRRLTIDYFFFTGPNRIRIWGVTEKVSLQFGVGLCTDAYSQTLRQRNNMRGVLVVEQLHDA